MKDLQEDNLFGSMRERLGRYDESPSEALWGKIASQKKKGRVWPIFLEPVGVVMLGIILLLNNDVRTDERTTNERTTDERTTDERTTDERTTDGSEVFQRNFKEKQIAFTPVVEILKKEEAPSIIEAQQTPNSKLETSSSKPETKQDSVEVESPIIVKQDSSSAPSPKEVIPPFKKPKSRFQFYLSVTPSLSFQKMSPSPNDQLIVQGFISPSPISMKRFGFSLDAGFQRDINRYFGYYGGLSFYHQDQELTYQYYNSQAEVTRVGDSFTYEIYRQERTKTFNYAMTNLGASAGMLVTLKGEKLKHKFGAGLMYTHSLNSSSSYLAYKLSYRNEMKVNDYISWYVEPGFVYSFIAKEKLDEPFSLKPYRAGISLGVLYRFKN